MVHLSLVAATRPGAARVAPAVAVAVLVALAALVVVSPAAASGTAPPPYIPPVADAVMVDHFRPPTGPYAAGNRGLDWVTRPGTPVVASAAGEVIFAGAVAGALHVTLLHADGLRTSYSYLAAVTVRTGDRVEQGAMIGLTGSLFHFGVRDPSGTYLDPEALFASEGSAHLVPGPDEGAAPLEPGGGWAGAERSALASVVATGRQLTSSLAGRTAALAHEAWSVSAASLGELAVEVVRWKGRFDDCTPAPDPVPPASGRRIAVLVAGLGSSSDRAAVDGVDVAALGYAPADVVRFSYGGGRIPGAVAGGALAALPTSSYEPSDTEVDLHRSADRLLALLAATARVQPGVPIDVIAHSMGGLVVRLALHRAADPGDPSGVLDALGAVVTLGTPHQGADLATAVVAVDPRSIEGRALGAAASAAGLDVDLTSASIEQLAETSSVVSELARPVPEGVHLVSIGASGDLTVPDVRTAVPGAAHASVHLTGPHAHDRLPSDPGTTREIGLAVAGLPPTCPDLAGGLADLVTSHLIAQTEDALGLALATQVP